MDLREHPRHEVQIPVSFLGDDVAGKGTVSNLSLGGCAVKGDKLLRVGAFLELSVDLPGPEQNLSVDVAVVRWTLGEKFGLDFLQMQPEEQKRLRRFIRSL